MFTLLTSELAIEQVARGAAVFDEMLPGWHQWINLDRLDISSCEDCVVGQLVGDYRFNAERVREFIRMRTGQPVSILTDYGLTSEISGDMELLTQSWIDLIEKRRADEGIL